MKTELDMKKDVYQEISDSIKAQKEITKELNRSRSRVKSQMARLRDLDNRISEHIAAVGISIRALESIKRK